MSSAADGRMTNRRRSRIDVGCDCLCFPHLENCGMRRVWQASVCAFPTLRVLLRSLSSCYALPGGASACALLSATCLSAAVATLLPAWADGEGTKQGVPIIVFLLRSLTYRVSKKEKKNGRESRCSRFEPTCKKASWKSRPASR